MAIGVYLCVYGIF